MIRLENVNKYFNRHKSNEIHVINNTSLELEETGIVALLGPSGCGKTTLLNAIGGLDKIGSGRIFVDGERISRRAAGRIDNIRNARIGYIFQNYNLLDDRTAFENVAIALRMIGLRDRKLIEERVNYCLKAVGIYQFRNRLAGALSGGQRQRVAIARAIVKNPKIIIADEPTGNLDSANTVEVMNVIRKLSKDRLVVLVTHERPIAEFYASRIIEMKDGSIVADYANAGDNKLSYQFDNRIYLKDMAHGARVEHNGIRYRLYSDEREPDEQPPMISLVVRGGNLYIDTGGRLNVVDENSGATLINDHYHALDQSSLNENAFEYDRYFPDDFKPKYRSIYTPWNMLLKGFRQIGSFRMVKKLLLVGFVFAAMFAFLAVSNVMGILTVEPEDFLTSNANYVVVANPKHSTELLNKVANMDEARYVITGDSKISVSVPIDDYYQTTGMTESMDVSLAKTEVIGNADLLYGTMPEDSHEIVLDKMAIDNFLDNGFGSGIGLTGAKQFIGRKIRVNNLDDYTITGITDLHSPSMYVESEQALYILTNASGQYDEDETDMDTYDEESSSIVDYALKDDGVKLVKGEKPNKTYTAVINETLKDEYKIGKKLDEKVNGHKLVVSGYYSSELYDDQTIYVSRETVRIGYLAKNKNFCVYADDVYAMSAALDDEGISNQIAYDRDKSSYDKEHKESSRTSLIVAGVLLLISLIEMFLMLRSSFLARIKEVGIMRAIGLKKRDIYRMFAGEVLAITFVTAVPGIALIYEIMKAFTSAADYFASLYTVAPEVAGITLILLILFNLAVGLIPVWNTLRKTPAQILARTDI